MHSKDRAPHGRGMAWATLLVAGGISLGVNLWHAFDQADHHGHGHVTSWLGALAVMYGTAPVVLAAFQSHSAAFTPKGWFRLTLTYVLMLLGMALSLRAQAAAVEPFAGKGWRWVFPVMVDLSTIEALITLVISARSRVRTAAPATGVPDAEPVHAPAVDAEPVPVYVTGPSTVPAGLAEPLERSTPDVPAAPAPTVPVQTGGLQEAVPADRTAPVPAAQTTPVQSAAPVPDRPVPAAQTTDVPALTSTKDGDDDALERLDRAFAGADPAEVSIRQVRRELDGAGYARAKRLHGLWAARTAGSARAGTADDDADREAGTDGETEPDRAADRVSVPA